MKSIRIGSGRRLFGRPHRTGVSSWREQGDIQYLVFECLAERTIAIAQGAKRKDRGQRLRPAAGRRACGRCWSPATAGASASSPTWGAANPAAGAAKIREIARSLGLEGAEDRRGVGATMCWRRWSPAATASRRPAPRWQSWPTGWVSANAYLGAAPLVEALRAAAPTW